MKIHAIAAAAALGFALGATALPARAAGFDGKMPLYPKGHVVAQETSIPASALAQGVPYNQTTSDSVATVDAWYAKHAGAGCTRQAASGAVMYKCPGGSIVIQTHGGTFISFVPPIGGL